MADARRKRIENALWGLFVGDSLAMPAHWFYGSGSIMKQWPEGIAGFEDPPHPHPEAFMVGMSYEPDLESCKATGRKFDILHENAKFYRTTFSKFEMDVSSREGAHGNAVAAEDVRYHYHHGLKAGDITTGAQTAKILIQSVNKTGRYHEDAFLDDFVGYMTTPGNNKDAYREVYLRRWFEEYSKGTAIDMCAYSQRKSWSIGSTGGIIRPMVVSMLAPNEFQGLGIAVEHQTLTHRSVALSSAVSVVVPLLRELIEGKDPYAAVVEAGRKVHAPKINGHDLKAMYRAHKGPGNIPRDQAWALHVDLREEAMDLASLSRLPEEEVVNSQIGTECYTEHTLPLALYHAAKYPGDFKAAVLAGVHAGGDNVHRCAMLGMLMGATDPRVAELAKGLREYETLKKEITAFADAAMSGKALLIQG